MNLLVRATCEVEKMSHASITNLGGGESSLRLLPLLFRFFFTRELKKLKNGDTEVCYFNFHWNDKNGPFKGHLHF